MCLFSLLFSNWLEIHNPSYAFTNYRDKETLIKAYDQDDEIRFPQSNVKSQKFNIQDRWGF